MLRSVAGGYGHWCPGCEEMHVFHVSRPAPSGARWTWDNNAEAPTFKPSMVVATRCHYFLTAGRIQFLDDCTHALRGQTVDLPDLP